MNAVCLHAELAEVTMISLIEITVTSTTFYVTNERKSFYFEMS